MSSADASGFERNLQRYADLRNQYGNHEEAARWLEGLVPADEIERLRDAWQERIGEIRAGALSRGDNGDGGWYVPGLTMPRWHFVREQLEARLPQAVDRIDETSDRLVSWLADPMGRSIGTRGLALGHVQSGKTTNFLAVAAKAADCGYDLIIVLAGIHNSLRRQTQNRAQRTLFHRSHLWWTGTGSGDFEGDANDLGAHLHGDGKRGLLVVKKNATVLRKLADWLEDSEDATLRATSILVIDDEADQAGLDVAPGDAVEGVHEQVLRIVTLADSDRHPRVAYLAYTATPYANVLTSQDAEGLYPRDFILPLPKPIGHIGPPELFDEEAIGRPVHVVEDPSGGHGDSGQDLGADLRRAIRWFVMATAARAVIEGGRDRFHSTMLVHTSQSTDEQLAYQPVVNAFLSELQMSLDDEDYRDELRREYEEECERVPAEACGEEHVAWDAVEAHIPEVLRVLLDREPVAAPFMEDGRWQQAHSGVIVDNSKVAWLDRLTYSDLDDGEPGVTIIAIGGNTLSRGLTLEGLVSSYFVRTSRTYDTLMQMGRWFGFRPRYRHLTRLWTTQDLLANFRDLTDVELGLRDELDWMIANHKKPSEYAVRIQLLPGLEVTRSAAMRSVAVRPSYSDYPATTVHLYLDAEVLRNNLDATRSLVHAIGDGFTAPAGRAVWVAEGVPVGRIRQYLEEFHFHPDDYRMDSGALLNYIDREGDALTSWNVGVTSQTTGPGSVDLGGTVGSVQTITRSRFEYPGDHASIGVLANPDDDRLDLNGEASDARHRDVGEPPLLAIYPIDKNSQPRDGSADRVPMGAPADVIGLTIFFPKSETSHNVTHVEPALRRTTPESEESDEAARLLQGTQE